MTHSREQMPTPRRGPTPAAFVPAAFAVVIVVSVAGAAAGAGLFRDQVSPAPPAPVATAEPTPTPSITATPVPSSSPTETTSPATSSATADEVYYRTCAEARRAGAAPLRRGEPGYRSALDRDGDGTACDS